MESRRLAAAVNLLQNASVDDLREADRREDVLPADVFLPELFFFEEEVFFFGAF